MKTAIRLIVDKLFTFAAAGSVLLIATTLFIVLMPMFRKGVSAVIFTETIEFRKLQNDLHGRGDKNKLDKDIQQVASIRKTMYDILAEFSLGINTDSLVLDAKDMYQKYGEYLTYHNIPKEQYSEYRSQARKLRDALIDALQSTDKEVVLANLDKILDQKSNPIYQATPIEKLIAIAEKYRKTAEKMDLNQRTEYLANLQEVTTGIRKLLGPLPGEDQPPLMMDKYGATRLDMAQKALYSILYDEQWVSVTAGQSLEKKIISRKEQFAGTALEPLFDYAETNFKKMLMPHFRIYWQYFIDDWVNSHYFGGVGPEILGTLLITIVSMLVAIPLGVISASYLVEYAPDTIWVKVIRICINTLAGVPSIVYGLFGLAFFVIILIGKPCVLAASLTMSILVLPVIIRASEEAIRSVPDAYREASLALGAGKFRTLTTVILPAAGPGILTGIILSLSRAAGETAPILFTGAAAMAPIASFGAPEQWANNPGSVFGWLFNPTRVLSYGSYDIAVGDRISMLVPHQQFGMVMTLILLVLILNIAAIIIRSRLSKKLRGY